MTNEMVNMTWFDNVGEVSSDKMILLNLTQYASSMYEEQELRSKFRLSNEIRNLVQSILVCY